MPNGRTYKDHFTWDPGTAVQGFQQKLINPLVQKLTGLNLNDPVDRDAALALIFPFAPTEEERAAQGGEIPFVTDLVADLENVAARGVRGGGARTLLRETTQGAIYGALGVDEPEQSIIPKIDRLRRAQRAAEKGE
jgi:hypothetical protein